MPQELWRQTSFNGGELDPHLRGRRDTKAYFSCLGYAENLICLPGGSVARRPGTVFIDYVRHTLTAVPLTVEMLYTGNGGYVANLLDAGAGAFVTAYPIEDADHLIFAIDFGAPVTVGLADLIDYAVKEPAAATPEPPPFQYPFDPPLQIGPIYPGGIEP